MIFSVILSSFLVTTLYANSDAPELANYISEEFNKDVPNVISNHGSATYSIPIQVPPGRSGMIPKIAIQYNSNQKNGILGVGWDLNSNYIQRSTKDLDYSDNAFQVKIAGSISDLVSRCQWE